MQQNDSPAAAPDRETIEEQTQKATAARLSRIDQEFADGFKLIGQYNDTVTIFGSARFQADNPYYQQARDIATALSQEGYTIVTGGGGGIMEAGNRGATDADGHSIGLNIKLPHEQSLNTYATDSMAFRYFFTRKVILTYDARAYLYFPGGFGTLDEFFEVITLIQTKKMPPAPIILVGSEFWTGLDMFIRTYLRDHTHAIGENDTDLYTITDDIEVIKAVINHHRDSANAFTAIEQEPLEV